MEENHGKLFVPPHRNQHCIFIPSFSGGVALESGYHLLALPYTEALGEISVAGMEPRQFCPMSFSCGCLECGYDVGA